MIGIVSPGFSGLVIAREYIESSLKSGKLQGASSSRTSKKESSTDSHKEEKDEADAIWEAPPTSVYNSCSIPVTTVSWSSVPETMGRSSFKSAYPGS